MPRNRAKLQTLTRLLSHREQQARQAMAARQQAVEGARAQADELAGMQREYQERLTTTSGAGVRASDLQLWRRFTQSLDDVVAVQGLQVEQLRRELEQAQADCQAARVRSKGGELLEAAEQRREAHDERRQERVAGSDLAARRSRL